jgi:lysophospholipase L1-like esterase
MVTQTRRDDAEHGRSSTAEPGFTPPGSGRGRRKMPAGDVLIVILVCLLIWGALYAPELKRSSEAQPDGLRRTVSLAILDPVVWVTDHIGLTAVANGVSRALGRDPNAPVGGLTGDIPNDVDELPTYSPPPGQGGKHHNQGPPVVDTRLREPTGDETLRIVVVGDSLAQGIGYTAQRVFKPFFTDVVRQGRISTGLARPDYFNWPAQMRHIIDVYRPDLTIVMLGENDNQSLLTPGGHLVQSIGTFEWAGAYQDRAQRFARVATSKGGHVVWVGLPNVRDASRWTFIQRQDQIFADVADGLPNVAYFDTWDTFAKSDGGYTAYYRDGGNVKLVRGDDGVHFNSDGYTILMELVAQFTSQEFQLDPKTYGG